MAYRYQTIAEKIDKYTKNRFFVNVVYPSIPPTSNDVYIVTRVGDRLDLLAFSYYGDEGLFWIISRTNPDLVRRDSITWLHYLTELFIQIPSINPVTLEWLLW